MDIVGDPLFIDACAKSQEIYRALMIRVRIRLYTLRKGLTKYNKQRPLFTADRLKRLEVIKSEFQVLQSTVEQCFSNAPRNALREMKRRLERLRVKLMAVSLDALRAQETFNEMDVDQQKKLPPLLVDNPDHSQQASLGNEQCQDEFSTDLYPKTAYKLQNLEKSTREGSTETMTNSSDASFQTLTNYGTESPNLSNWNPKSAQSTENLDKWPRGDSTDASFHTLTHYVSESLSLYLLPDGAARESAQKGESTQRPNPWFVDNGPIYEDVSGATQAKYWLRKFANCPYFVPDAEEKSPATDNFQMAVAPSTVDNNILETSLPKTAESATTSQAPPSGQVADVHLTKSLRAWRKRPTMVSANSSTASPGGAADTSLVEESQTAPPTDVDETPGENFPATSATPSGGRSAVPERNGVRMSYTENDTAVEAPSMADAVNPGVSSSRPAEPPTLVESVIPSFIAAPSTASPPIDEAVVAGADATSTVAPSMGIPTFLALPPYFGPSTITRPATISEPTLDAVIPSTTTPGSSSVESQPQKEKISSASSEFQDSGVEAKRMCVENLPNYRVLFTETNVLFSDESLPSNFWQLPLQDVEIPTEIIDKIDSW